MVENRAIQLSQDQIKRYHDDGYLVVDDLLAPDEVAAFVAHESAAKPPEFDKGLLSHTVDPQWSYVARHRNVAGVARQLAGGASLRIVQSMYMPKPPAKPPQKPVPGVAIHQDQHFLPTQPTSLMACWIAMGDTGGDNGGLCVVPGSHLGPLHPVRSNQDEEHNAWEHVHLMRDRDGRQWEQKFSAFQIDDVDPDQLVRLTVRPGSGVFFTSMTIHGSFANRSPTQSRLAFAVHYVTEGTWVYRADVQETDAVDGPGAGGAGISS